MTEKHEAHLNSIIAAFTEKVIAKYEAGVREHGGHLEEMPLEHLAVELENELIDGFVYLATMKPKIEALLERIKLFTIPPYKEEPND